MIVSNSTPLIAFARINQLMLLQKVVAEIVIPGAVANEISQYTEKKQGLIDLVKESWITIKKVQSIAQVQLLLPTLDRGEAEVIALAREQQADLVLIDELTGRKVAESLGLHISGSIGILIQAKKTGILQSVKPFIDEMTKHGIYYSRNFINSVLKYTGERK
ncbi:DUF3368 domain-containing protein [candidate division KSB1 bacterium]|nr:DUF3368 domain-containing protein [candidate division KSB1 bacterium]